MNSKPMSYDSIRTLLPYLEGNKRIQLASRAPFLRSMEKILPLKLESLKYGLDSIKINGTEYKVGVVRHYDGNVAIHNSEKQEKFLQSFCEKFQIRNSDGSFKNEESERMYYQFLKDRTTEDLFQKEHPKDKSDSHSCWKNEMAKVLDFYGSYPRQDTPEHVRNQNRRGGLPHDFDEYGFQDFDSLRTGEPGDIVMKEFQRTAVMNGDRDMENLEKAYQEAKREYNGLYQLCLLNPDGMFVDNCSKLEYFNFILSHTDQQVYDYHMQLRNNGEIARSCKDKVDIVSDTLQPFYNRKYNIPLEYTPYIQLSINEKPTQLVKYNKKLNCALRELFLTRRRDPVRVDTLIVNQEDIIRVPPGSKFKIRKLDLQGNLLLMCDSLKPIIDESRYPLEEVSVFHTFHIGWTQHETIRTARRLIFRSPVWLQTLLNLQNKIVHVVNDRGTLTVVDYIELIESWMNDVKEIGTTWTFGVSNQGTLTLLMKAIPHGDRVGATERSIPLPLINSLLLVSYIEDPSGAPERYLLKMTIETM